MFCVPLSDFLLQVWGVVCDVPWRWAWRAGARLPPGSLPPLSQVRHWWLWCSLLPPPRHLPECSCQARTGPLPVLTGDGLTPSLFSFSLSLLFCFEVSPSTCWLLYEVLLCTCWLLYEVLLCTCWHLYEVPLCTCWHLYKVPPYTCWHLYEVPPCTCWHLYEVPMCTCWHLYEVPLCTCWHLYEVPLCTCWHLYEVPLCTYWQLSTKAFANTGPWLLCLQLGLPLSCICTVPCNTVFGASSKMVSAACI